MIRKLAALTVVVAVVVVVLGVPFSVYASDEADQASTGEIGGGALSQPAAGQRAKPKNVLTIGGRPLWQLVTAPRLDVPRAPVNDSSTRGQPSSGETSTSGVALGEQGAAVSRSFQDLRGRVKPGTTVSVIDTTGNEIRGEIVEIASSSLALLIDGNRRDLPESSVLRIARRGDPVWNGTATGAAVGAGVGLAILGALCEGICRGPVETTAPSCTLYHGCRDRHRGAGRCSHPWRNIDLSSEWGTQWVGVGVTDHLERAERRGRLAVLLKFGTTPFAGPRQHRRFRGALWNEYRKVAADENRPQGEP